MNFLKRTDSYKVSQSLQYPPDAEIVYSYLESRGGEFDEIVFFGLQYYLEKYLAGKVFNQDDIDEADIFFGRHFQNRNVFNRRGWEYILDAYGGRLPLLIKAPPEGSVIPVNNVLMTIENTDPKVPWLTNYVESLLLKIWYPITVATMSREIKKVIKKYLELTGEISLLPFKLHDFGYRGASSEETAMIGGAAHLVNFLGTDTLVGVDMLEEYYKPEDIPAFSIPASEHSTITSWGQEHEVDAMRNMLQKYPTGIIACVSDSYDIFNACAHIWGEQLKTEVLARDGVLVVRPDSGDPVPTMLKVLNILGEKFGTTLNNKNKKLLNPKVRVVQGDKNDSVSSIERMLDTMKWQGWSADNITFGMGGALLQKVDRDTQKFAIKCSAIRRNGQWQDVYKTAVGKASKRGRMELVENNGKYETTNIIGSSLSRNVLQEVFRDGTVLSTPMLSNIRRRAEI